MLEADGGGAATQAAYEVWGSGVLGGAVVGTAVATGSGGGFEFPSVEEMNSVKGMWQERQESILQKKNLIESAQQQLGVLADDDVSQDYLKQARDSLDLLHDQHTSMLGYVTNYIQKLTDATNAKQANEDNNEAALRNATT